MKAINKASVKAFFVSSLVTALVILFCLSFVVVGVNSSKTGLKRVSDAFSVKLSGDKLKITVIDKKFMVTFSALEQVDLSRLLGGCVVWLFV